MVKQGEREYLSNIGLDGIDHSINKPFSDVKCGEYLMEIGLIMCLLPNTPSTLLDFGCGTGWTSCFFAKRGYDVTAQDIAALNIEYAMINKKKEHIENLKFVVSDYEDLNFNSEFDCAVFFDCLHHAENEGNALRSAYKALKPGGVLVICEPGKGHGKNSQSIDAVKKYNVTEKDMPPGHVVKIGKQVGFSESKIYPRLLQLYKAVYTRPQGRISRTLFKFGIVRLIAAVYLIVFYKHNIGLVVLVK